MTSMNKGTIILTLVIIASILISIFAFVDLSQLALTGPKDESVDVWTDPLHLPFGTVPTQFVGTFTSHIELNSEAIDTGNPNIVVSSFSIDSDISNTDVSTLNRGKSRIDVYYEISFTIDGTSIGTINGPSSGMLVDNWDFYNGPLSGVADSPGINYVVGGSDGDVVTAYVYYSITGWVDVGGNIMNVNENLASSFSSVFTESLIIPDNIIPTVSINTIETNAHISTTETDPLAVYVSGNTNDADGLVVKVDYDFGDGASDTFASQSIRNVGFTHIYPSHGTYEFKITVTDDQGGIGSTIGTVTISGVDDGDDYDQGDDPTNIPPSVSISLGTDITNLTSPATVIFMGSASDTDGTIESYYWDFGDGEDSTEQNPEHEFLDNGTFNVKLRVIDNDGGSATATIEIIVGEDVDTGPGELSNDMIIWMVLLFVVGLILILIPVITPSAIVIKIIFLLALLGFGLYLWFFGIPSILAFGLVLLFP